MQRDVQDGFGVIKVIAWIYLVLGVTLASLGLLHVQVAGQRLGLFSAILPALLALGAIGTLLRRQWGRYLSAFFSVILLFAVPTELSPARTRPSNSSARRIHKCFGL